MSEADKDEAASGGSSPAKTLYCSFCFKSQHEVKRLIFGPGSIFICDECVGLCNQIIADLPPNSKSPSPEELPTERLLERLGPIEETVQVKGCKQLWTCFDPAGSVGRKSVPHWVSPANPPGSGLREQYRVGSSYVDYHPEISLFAHHDLACGSLQGRGDWMKGGQSSGGETPRLRPIALPTMAGLLLQIICRCGDMKQSTQFLIVNRLARSRPAKAECPPTTRHRGIPLVAGNP